MTNQITIITHRGLDPGINNYYAESSFEAFKDQLNRGFGIEFDPCFIKNNRIIIVHDSTFQKISHGQSFQKISELDPKFMPINLNHGRLCFFEELLDLIRHSSSKINALHLKGPFQSDEYLDIFVNTLKTSTLDLLDRLILFDIKPETAKILKKNISGLHMAPSVAHYYDLERYNASVAGTLISVENAIKYKLEGLYDWVWLDEWDRTDKNGHDKTLYNPETFKKLKTIGYKIALVTPELHATSPGLLGGEAHPDADNHQKLIVRIKNILALKPDAVCTDYPDEVKNLQ
jgi:hypothetical protein